MKKHYSILAVGGTLTALGLASKDSESVIILERSASIGSEYINAHAPGKNWDKTKLSHYGLGLKKELIERNILAEGHAHIPALSPVLLNRIKNEKLNVLFWTELVEIKQNGNVFEATLFNASGLHKITVEKIIDTTSERLSAPGTKTINAKSINALLYCGEKCPRPLLKEMKIQRGRFASEKYLKVPVKIEDNWPAARKKLLESWQARPKEIESWKMASTASAFSYESTKGPFEVAKNWTHLPSSGYTNPLESLEAGITFAGETK